jgi:hypothetical protein
VEKKIGAKREFLQELLKEVRVRGSEITLTYKLPLRASESRFFTLLRLVGPPGLESFQRNRRINPKRREVAAGIEKCRYFSPTLSIP